MSTEGQWQLTGSAAERYERVLAPAIFAPWAADLIELAQLQDGERVLDVACGTGVVARHAAQKVGTAGRVTGLDLNQGMVEVARSLPPVPGAAPITWIEGSALAMHLPDAAFRRAVSARGSILSGQTSGLARDAACAGAGWPGAHQYMGKQRDSL